VKSLLNHRFSYLALLLPITLACNLSGVVKKAAEQAQQPRTFTSIDARVQITAPGGWREDKELSDEAVLTASDRAREMYLVIISERKDDFEEGTTLADFNELSRKGLMERIETPELTESVPLTVGPNSAMEYQAIGTVEKVKIKYLTTVVETPERFYQIFTWTLPSRFDLNQPTLRSVAQSFKEVTAPLPSSPSK
jgi:bifunctional DNA-binding transcriptional regulator/antitoxin component of YhaV-PrlF toxin-antitoxin module